VAVVKVLRAIDAESLKEISGAIANVALHPNAFGGAPCPRSVLA
jgi:hypothetical protein